MTESVPEPYRGLRSFAFGDSPDLADELLELVLNGVKTATCSTEDEPNTSTPGGRWIVLDGRRTPRCVIETLEVTYRRYGEDEGDRSLAYWRDAHRRYFGRLGRFSEDMMLMCERFRLVEIFEDATALASSAPTLTLPASGRGNSSVPALRAAYPSGKARPLSRLRGRAGVGAPRSRRSR